MGPRDGQEVAWLEILADYVRTVHEEMLDLGGGARGEHTASLYAACARPFQSAFGEDIYQDAYEQSAAILHGIVCDHVFVDGNKRTQLSLRWSSSALGRLSWTIATPISNSHCWAK